MDCSNRIFYRLAAIANTQCKIAQIQTHQTLRNTWLYLVKNQNGRRVGM